MRLKFTLIAIPALLLSACGSDTDTALGNNESDDRTAGGDVQGGTISDAMLPLESVRSQSPALAPEPADGATSGETSTPDGDDVSQEDPAPEPAAPTAEEAAE